jgi:tetratricopeptide (TPR) repeat protein
VEYSVETYLNVAKQKLAANDAAAALSAAVKGQLEYPDNAAIKIVLARAHMAANRFAGALLPLQHAESLDPGSLEVCLLLAECHNRRDQLYEAERYYRKALAGDPCNITAIANLEPIVREQGRYADARMLLEHLLTVFPKISLAIQTSLAMLDLSEGQLERGFQGYEHRFGFSHLQEAYGTPFCPRWTGRESLAGKSVLMRFEQGLGDTIQFARYAIQLKQRGASHVTILCKKTLHRLLLGMPSVDAVIDTVEQPAFDYEVMMMSMPALLNTKSEADIPGQPYLSVKPKDAKKWKKRLAAFAGPKVGLVWSGELKRGMGWEAERMNSRRSIPLDSLRPLFDAGCDFFSLQKGERQQDLVNFYTPHPVHDLMNDCEDFYDTACLVHNLDLIIAVDTSTAHLAAALGKPVWMLSRLDNCWRWMLDRTDSPWYPSLTIYRQDRFRDWHPVIRRLSVDLITHVETLQTQSDKPPASAPSPHPRTLIFCTAYAPTKEVWDGRYSRWIEALRNSTVQHDELLIVDDGSPTLPDWAETSNVTLHHFDDHLGRNTMQDFPGWYRSFMFAGKYAARKGFDKVIHIESDAFLVSPRMTEYCNTASDGWVAMWSPRYGMAETAIQICSGNAAIKKFANIETTLKMSPTRLAEHQLPFDRVEKRLKGDRYGETLEPVPLDADYVTQIPDKQPEGYCWWLK